MTEHELWPGGHRAALLIVIHVPAAADAAITNAAATLVGIDYAATGLQRLFDALGDLDLGVSTIWTAAGLASTPQLVRSAADHGHEIGISTTLESDDELTEVRETMQRLSGGTVSGIAELFASPVSSGPDARDRNDDFSWSISRLGGDFPSLGTVTSDGPTHVTLPTSPYWIDAVWLNPAVPAPPSSFLETLSTGLQSVRTIGGLMTVIVHPHISGRPGFAETFIRFVDEAIASGDVWIPRAGELAEWWRQRFGATADAE